MKLAALATVALLAGCLGTSDAPPPDLSTARLVLAFQACHRGCVEPEDNQTYLATSPDGASWTLVPGYSPYRGTSPDPIRRNDTIEVYSSPGFVRRYHITTGVADARNASGAGAVGRDVDVTAQPSMILDDGGRLVMFYLAGKPFAEDPGTCADAEAACTRLIRSATEDSGQPNPGLLWMDDGDRARIAVSAPGRASDPDVFRDAHGFVMLVTTERGTLLLRSPTLRGTFEPSGSLPDHLLVRSPIGPVAGEFADGRYQLFATDAGGNVTRAVVPTLDVPIEASAFSPVLVPARMPALGEGVELRDPGVVLYAT